MTRKQRGFGLSFFLIVAPIIAVFFLFATHTISLTNDDIQAKLNSHVVGKDFKPKGVRGMAIKSLTITSVTTKLHDNGSIETRTAARLETLAGGCDLFVDAVGIPEYAARAFYFRPTGKIEVATQNCSKASAAGNAEPQGTLAGKLKAFADKHTSPELKAAGRDLGDIAISWSKENTGDIAAYIFQHRPIFRLKDDVKGFVIGASLKKIEISGGNLHITFSLLQLTIWLMMWAAIFIGGIIILVLVSFSMPPFRISLDRNIIT
jgi:hypothetical protein